MKKASLQRLLSAVALCVLAACGGGGGDGPPPPPAAPAASNLIFTAGLKELQFTWTAISGATFYRLFENPDGVAGFSQVGADLTATSFNHTISVHRRMNASYRIDACNNVGCTASAVVTPGNSLAQAIGYFKASNTGASDAFGAAIALSADGNTLAVAASQEDSDTTGINSTPNEIGADAGAVYVFSRSGGAWVQEAYLKASNTGAGDRFGISVALSADGSTLAVGAQFEDSSGNGVDSTPDEAAIESGAVYVFVRGAAGWGQQAFVKALDSGTGDQFGISVALSGDGNTLAVGAHREDSSTMGVNTMPNDGALDSGAVYVFTRAGTVWSEQAYVKASNTEAGDRFGTSVALSTDGNTLAVGAHLEDSSAGAVYVFTRSGGVWSEQAYLKASNIGMGDLFGERIALSGDGNTLAVGARQEDSSTTGVNSMPDDAVADAGAVYVFSRSAGAWSQQAYIKASNTDADDLFGVSVALSADGDTLAVGAQRESSGTTGVNSTPNNAIATHSGAVYVFTRSAGVWSQQAFVKARNTGALDNFGSAVALSADGSTIAVGAQGESSSSTGVNSASNENASLAGAAYLY